MADPRLDVLHALRQKRSETQLTRAIAALGKHDNRLATQMAEAMVTTAAERGNRAASALVKGIPRSLAISNETPLGPVRLARRGASGGRLDWQIANDTFCLVVEVKIGAAVALQQLERYLGRFSNSDVAGGLILLTRTTADIPTKVERHGRWLGQIRWNELIPRLAAVTPADPIVAEEWKRLLCVIREPGDLADEPVGWQLAGHRPGERNRLVLAAVRDRARSTVARELAHRARTPTSDGLCGVNPNPRSRSVTIAGKRARLGLWVPAATKRGPVIDIDLAGSGKPLKLTTHVDPGPSRRAKRGAEHDRMLMALRREGFAELTSGVHAGWYAADDAITPTPDAPTAQEAVWVKLEGRLRAIMVSGILDSRVG